MARSKVAITLDDATLHRLDRLVAAGAFPNRSRAVEAAVADQLARLERTRLARESARLDPLPQLQPPTLRESHEV